jgi:hypothetical protein
MVEFGRVEFKTGNLKYGLKTMKVTSALKNPAPESLIKSDNE